MNTGQSRTASLVEAATNIVVGVVVAFVSQLAIFHAYGILVSYRQNVAMTLFFTLVSLVRQFVLRRLFNAATTRKAQDYGLLSIPRTLQAPGEELRLRQERYLRDDPPWNNVAPDGRSR